MKQIVKAKEPMEFVRWKESNPSKGYMDLKGLEKQALKRSLIEEQKQLCCYCESLITKATSHIEHFRPKDDTQFPELQLVYNNLHASCLLTPNGDSGEHCGHRKKNHFSALLVSPLEEDCQTHFTYELDGNIYGVDEKGRETIDILHLNSTLLQSKRVKLIDAFIDIALDDDMDIKNEIDCHLDETEESLHEFYTMIQYFSATNAFE